MKKGIDLIRDAYSALANTENSHDLKPKTRRKLSKLRAMLGNILFEGE